METILSFIKILSDKVSNYQFFNYSFTGFIFIVLYKLQYTTIVDSNWFIIAVISYFCGIVISRIGSLVVEPILKNKRINFVKFAKYGDFIEASKDDKKIEILSQENNMYRTFVGLFLTFLIVIIYKSIASFFNFSNITNHYALVISLLVLFLFSYRKQTSYVRKRVEHSIEKNNNKNK